MPLRRRHGPGDAQCARVRRLYSGRSSGVEKGAELLRNPLFDDRTQAGEALARELLDRLGETPAPLVLALPRGGVPVGLPVAQAFGVPLDVLVVRKLGVPGHSELALGAVSYADTRVLNEEVVSSFAISPEVIEHVTLRESEEVERRERLYRAGRPPLEPAGRRVLLIDDGLATGASMRAAVELVKQHQPAQIVVGVPVAAREVSDGLARLAHEVVVLHTPQPFMAVGRWYRHFEQVSDEEVRELLS